MHFDPMSGSLEFVNSHCPVLPFWTEPGDAFQERWIAMHKLLSQLENRNYPYELENQAEQAVDARP